MKKSILYFSVVISQLASLVTAGSSSYTSRQATFIPPASPIITRATTNKVDHAATEALSFARSQMITGGYGLYPTTTPSTTPTSTAASHAATSTQLYAKKKKAAPAATKKIQVKMLKPVAGTGQPGQVVKVTPAFFNNKLRPQQAAKIITDEEVAAEDAEKQQKEDAEKAKANELKERLDEMTLTLTRKAGPDGHLFGGIGPKVIMNELKSEIGDDFLSKRSVKVDAVLDENGKKMRGDIKVIGKFGSRINLLKGISAKIGITIEAE